MGGRISVESELGQGSIFQFTIQADMTTLQSRIMPSNTVPMLSGLRVLVVDDLEINRRILLYYMQIWGMEAYACADSTDAIRWIERGDPFDLALVDYQMPHINGVTLARSLRRHRSRQQLPIILLSSMMVDTRSEADIIDTTMLKPIKPSQLLEAITALFAQSPSQPQLLQSPPTQLPLTPVPTQPSTPSDTPLPHELGTQTPLSILVAEDNQVNQLVIGMLLEHLGYQADYAANGKEVLAALERQPYDVVFMDVQMPIMDGISATRELCGQYAVNSRPRIVGMTGNVLPEVRLECERAGMNDYVTKPVTGEALVAALSRCTPIKSSSSLEPQHRQHL